MPLYQCIKDEQMWSRVQMLTWTVKIEINIGGCSTGLLAAAFMHAGAAAL